MSCSGTADLNYRNPHRSVSFHMKNPEYQCCHFKEGQRHDCEAEQGSAMLAYCCENPNVFKQKNR